MIALVFLLSLLISSEEVFGTNILFASDVASPSHEIWNYAIAEALVAKGHNVTMLSPFYDKKKLNKNYHILHVTGFEADEIDEDIDELVNLNALRSIMFFQEAGLEWCNMSYHSEGLQQLKNYPKDFKFDLIIFDMTASSCFLPLIQKFNYPPSVGVTAFLLPSYLSRLFGNSLQPAYLPMFASQFSENMQFLERVQNYLLINIDTIVTNYYSGSLDALAREAFGSDVDSFSSLARRVSILLSNLSPVLHYPQPITPNIIPVGGLHIKPAKILPKDLQDIMDNATHGVILFALGSNIKSSHLSVEKRRILLDAFSQLKQTVIWKFETELPDLPKNVIIRKWLPQTEILAHPKLKLFISHGGGLSTLEAAYFGVPIIGIPFFLDQHLNVDIMVHKKMALRVDFKTLTSNVLVGSINEILENSIYLENVKDVSRRMRDQPETPLERAVFWIEYVMRHNGAQFLSPKARDMSTFTSTSLDVQIFLFISTYLFIYVLYKISAFILKAVRRQSKNKKKIE